MAKYTPVRPAPLAGPSNKPNYGIIPKSDETAQASQQFFEMVDGQPLIKFCSERYRALRNSRLPFERIWNDIDEYIMPLIISPWRTNPWLAVSKKIFDGAPINAKRIMVNGFVSATTPRATNWSGLYTPDFDKDTDPELQNYLMKAEDKISGEYADSNFYEDVYPFVDNGVAYGTSVRIIRESSIDDDEIYETLDHRSFYIDENEDGEVDTLFRNIPMSNRKICRMFGKFLQTYDAGKRHYDLLMENQNGFSRVVQGIFPRTDFTAGNLTSTNFPYASVYFPENAGGDDGGRGASESFPVIYDVSGYKDAPFDAWRFQRIPGFVYGMCPGIWALRDSQVLNQQAMTLLRAAHMAVDPPWALPQEIEGREEIFPGGRNWISMVGSKPEPMVSGMQYPVGTDAHDRLVKAVNDHFGIDFWMTLAQSQNGGQEMTATQVDAIKAEQQAMVQSMVSSYESQVLEPQVERTFARLVSNGTIEPFQGNYQGKSIELKIEFIGPLAQLARRLHITGNIQQFLQAVLPYAQIKGPQVLDPIDDDNYIKTMANGYRVGNVLKTDQKLEQERKAKQQMIQQQMQQQQQIEAMNATANMAGKGGKAPEQGSPMAGLLAQHGAPPSSFASQGGQ